MEKLLRETVAEPVSSNNRVVTDPYLCKVKGNSNGEEAEGGIGLFPWPPRYYTCGFCKRQFKSAQALGGHMNVHRRERARLTVLRRQSSSSSPAPPMELDRHIPPHQYFTILNLNIQSSSSASFPTRFDHNTSSSSKPPLKYLKLSNNNLSMVRDEKSDNDVSASEDCKIWNNKGENLVEISLLPSSHQDLDLELRLGCH